VDAAAVVDLAAGVAAAAHVVAQERRARRATPTLLLDGPHLLLRVAPMPPVALPPSVDLPEIMPQVDPVDPVDPADAVDAVDLADSADRAA